MALHYFQSDFLLRCGCQGTKSSSNRGFLVFLEIHGLCNIIKKCKISQNRGFLTFLNTKVTQCYNVCCDEIEYMIAHSKHHVKT